VRHAFALQPPRYNGAYCVGDGTFGLVGNSQYDECNRWCLIRCPRKGEAGAGAWAEGGTGGRGARQGGTPERSGRGRGQAGALTPPATAGARGEASHTPEAAGSLPPTRALLVRSHGRRPASIPPPATPPDGGADAFASQRYRDGFYGVTNYYPSYFYASIDDDNATSPASAIGTANATGAAKAATPAPPAAFEPTRPMQAAACAMAARLEAAPLRGGAVDPGEGLGLAFPALAVAKGGAAVIGFTLSGAWRLPNATEEAYPGVGLAVVPPGASGAAPAAAAAKSGLPIVPAEVGAVRSWGELSAADAHPVTGAVYVAARRGGPTRTGRSHVATWVAMLAPRGAADATARRL
jgi:hypothetical protein